MLAYFINEDDVMVIEVKEGSKKPYYLQKNGPTPSGVYIRIGRSSRKASFDEITDMMVNSSGITFEDEISINQDLTFDSLKDYNKSHNGALDLSRFESNGFISDSGEFTNLAYLFSDQNLCCKICSLSRSYKNQF